MKKLIFIILTLAGTLWAGDGGYQFLRVGVTARAAALGDAYVSQPGDATTFMYNPAGLAALDHAQVSASYMNHILDIGSGYAAYAQPFPRFGGVIGGGIVYFNYGDFQGYDLFGNPTTTYSASDMAFQVFHARKITDRLDAGVTLKYIHSSIENYSSSALAIDLGGLYHFEEYKLNVGASLLNAGFATSAFVKHKESLPLSLQVGASKQLEHAPILLSFGLSDLNVPQSSFLKRFENYVAGAEWTPRDHFVIRAGYNNQRKSELHTDDQGFPGSWTGFSIGLGVTYQKYIFDYSFTSWGIGVLNRFSLTFNL